MPVPISPTTRFRCSELQEEIGPRDLDHAARSHSGRLTDMSLISAGLVAELDGYLGYMEPNTTSHEALDRDLIFRREVENAARALAMRHAREPARSSIPAMVLPIRIRNDAAC